jgi:hypothetical protein
MNRDRQILALSRPPSAGEYETADVEHMCGRDRAASGRARSDLARRIEHAGAERLRHPSASRTAKVIFAGVAARPIQETNAFVQFRRGRLAASGRPSSWTCSCHCRP